ncbi:peptide chain release factor N(5)-glutamine methyltransferase [Pseudoblastomonas halimionae]|uniref:Release factor glutamine methyltransferase n=1 Tax=Alteriqipengyuania halimionae TaxID=1926630 RepID=A0A6I4U9X5_9SPHN|nr:peptide chain release factor N(5)-glutamine methyltransferase [Alteriqipengyuania halimionae]MXP11077.1 peptide chain release factor N(5)-glutamine methyltransferase [Alteriqipengyuania halimionae]
MTVAEALRDATARLADNGDTARIDAEMLMAHALGMSRSDMLLKAMRDPTPADFADMVERRASHEPVAYIVGQKEFYGLDFTVRPGVLIPRGDSETIVRAALDRAPRARRVLDLGVGSGALLLATLSEMPKAEGVGVDASPVAIDVATGNAQSLGLGDRVDFLRASWRNIGWRDALGRFDLVLCNPPYVEDDAALDPDVRDFEPGEALFAGREGLDDYRLLLPQLAWLLDDSGVAVFEIGYRQADAVSQIAAGNGFETELRRDLADRPRALILRRIP